MKGFVASYQTKTGRRWRIVYDGPPDLQTGKRRQHQKRGFVRERDAQRALREALGSVEQGTYVESSKTTVAEYLRQWLDGIRVKPTTLANYRQSAEIYVIPRIGGVAVQALRAEHLDTLYRELERSGKRDGTGLSPKSVRHVHTMLRRALRDAVDRGHVLHNVADLANPPTQRQARSRAAQHNVWTGEQLRRFLAHVEGDRLYAAWLLLATTGMRRGEVAGLPWRDVDLDGARLRVAQTVTVASGSLVWADEAKTDAGGRVVALDPTTVTALRAHWTRQQKERRAVGPGWVDDEHGPLVFPWADGTPIHPDRMRDALASHARACGLPVITVHGLRHSYSTAALRAGVSPEVLSKRIGHADVATTLSVYAHVRDEDDEHGAATAAAAILGT